MAVTCGDGVGFDVLSFDEGDESERLIEVKTTGLGKHFPFYVTANEVRCSEDCPERFRLYRVFDFARDPGSTSSAGRCLGSAGWSRWCTGRRSEGEPRRAGPEEVQMATRTFMEFFRSQDSKRDNFLARLFALFSEETIRIWCKDASSPYEDLGRPTIYRLGESGRGQTLDFTLRSRRDGRAFVAEMKCEIAYENYKSMILKDHSQLERHAAGRAFKMFLDLASAPEAFRVMVKGRPLPVAGAVLVWGATTPQGRDDVLSHASVTDVLSVEEAISKLTATRNPEYWLSSRSDVAGAVGCSTTWHPRPRDR